MKNITMHDLFEALDAARLVRGHTIPAACAEIGISMPTWIAWRHGKVETPLILQRQAAERYIAAAAPPAPTMEYPTLSCPHCGQRGLGFRAESTSTEPWGGKYIVTWEVGFYVCPGCGAEDRHARVVNIKEI